MLRFIKTRLQREILNRLYVNDGESERDFIERLTNFVNRYNKGDEEIKESIINGDFTFATPILRNAGVPNKMQFSSCFLVEPDYTDYGSTLKQLYDISISGGGIGITLARVPSSTSTVSFNRGMCGVVNHVNLINWIMSVAFQSFYRKGSATIYLDIWHSDVMDFLDVKNPSMTDRRVLSVHTGLLLNNLFLEAVLKDDDWYLFDGADPRVQDLHKLSGSKFNTEYGKLVKLRVFEKRVSSRDLYNKILTILTRTGEPFILHSDNINNCNMHDYLGKIRGSNLCTEIMQYHDPRCTSACTLASINLANCVKNGIFDFDHLDRVIKLVVSSLNTILCKTKYPVDVDVGSRPIGVGVQGFANALVKMNIYYEDGGDLLERIFEHLYYFSLDSSCDYAKKTGVVFEKFEKSPYGRGEFYFERWGENYSKRVNTTLNWDSLRKKIRAFGLANSMFIAQMPTATTALFLDNTEGLEPLAPAIDRKKNSFGEFLVYSPFINEKDKQELQEVGGMITKMINKPPNWALLKSVYEMSPEIYMKIVARALPFIDQAVSLTMYLPDDEENDFQRLTNWIYASWRAGFKTAMYYCRMHPVSKGINVFKVCNNNTCCSA